ncbi:putative ATP-binding protein involved in virulence [Pseudomonas helmanticensis]|uniref:Putative ATP-binding protein involved in virulence n=1 Tax=Pseudomonas helmanticensis TaxID=1471381 RepID=A0A4R7VHK0_9PSED|nr:AAA family ATPase [Pseudomonas helmanticensis]TDV48627.1 putative ATP-binding protein involved in virulence [Pseudomonas helmanticensis]
MRLDRLHIQNFRCYEDATFDLQPRFNLVVGVNGSGKTSLLQAIAVSFIEFGNAVKPSQISIKDEDIRFVIDRFENRSRFERQYPLLVQGTGLFFGATEWILKRDGDSFPPLVNSAFDAEMVKLKQKINLAMPIDLPVLAFYRSNRRWQGAGVSAEFAAKQRLSRFDGYANWFDAVADLSDFESWLISRTLERMQDLLDANQHSADFNDELVWVNSSIACAIPNAQNLRYDLRLQSLLIDIDQKTIPFNELSDGQRGMIALFTDIARRMCILNPHMGKDVLKNTSGVIIIDELDIHLHPAWQRSIVPALTKAFPKVQFIAASHSPQIIGSLKPEEVIVLHNGESSHPRVTYGLDSSSVLEEVMGVGQREPEIENLLSELFSTLEDNDLKRAKSQLEALKKKAPDLPEFAGAEALLRRKEILGK